MKTVKMRWMVWTCHVLLREVGAVWSQTSLWQLQDAAGHYRQTEVEGHDELTSLNGVLDDSGSDLRWVHKAKIRQLPRVCKRCLIKQFYCLK